MDRGTASWLALPLLAAMQAGAPIAQTEEPTPASSAALSAPQEPAVQGQQTQTLNVSTRLVVLDVVVTDKSGKPVLNLTKDDFAVTEEQEPQTIRNFDPPSAHALPPGDLVHSTADLSKIGDATVNILVLDELNTPFEDNAFSRYSMQKFLKRQPATMAPTDLLVVNDKSFSVLHDYTQNRDDLLAAVKHDPVVYPWRRSMNGGAGEDGVVRLGQSLQALQAIAQAAAGTPGRKTIIWVGKGFPSVDLTNLDDDSASKLGSAIKRCTDLLLQSRVTLYIVDPTALSSTQYDTDPTQTPTDLAALEEETGDEPFSNGIRFSTLAPATGGRVFRLRNDVDQEIASSIEEGSYYYTISYKPTSEADVPGEYRHIRIIMKNPDLIATTRDGYYAPGVPATTAEAGVKEAKVAAGLEVVDVANAALSKLVYTGVKLRVSQDQPGRYGVAVADSSLSWNATTDDMSSAAVTVVTVCFSAKGKVLSHDTSEQTFKTKSPNNRPNAEEIFTLPVVLAPGTARLRLIVRDATSGRLGTADVSVTGP